MDARQLLAQLIAQIAAVNPDVPDLQGRIWRQIEQGLHSYHTRKSERLNGLGLDEVINLRRGARQAAGVIELTEADWTRATEAL